MKLRNFLYLNTKVVEDYVLMDKNIYPICIDTATQAFIFHPKVYLAQNQISATLITGIVSAYDLSEIEDEAKAAGANLFISKPLFQSTVCNVLMNLSGGKYTKLTAAEEDYDFGGKRLLLAEDNALNREIATELLEMVNLKIDCAENGQEALDRFAASQPGYYSAILMDIQMPIMDGYEAARKIRSSAHAQAATIPIFAMTANAFTEDVSAALSSGMNGHIAKPIDTEVLYSTLQKCFEGKKS